MPEFSEKERMWCSAVRTYKVTRSVPHCTVTNRVRFPVTMSVQEINDLDAAAKEIYEGVWRKAPASMHPKHAPAARIRKHAYTSTHPHTHACEQANDLGSKLREKEIEGEQYTESLETAVKEAREAYRGVMLKAIPALKPDSFRFTSEVEEKLASMVQQGSRYTVFSQTAANVIVCTVDCDVNAFSKDGTELFKRQITKGQKLQISSNGGVRDANGILMPGGGVVPSEHGSSAVKIEVGIDNCPTERWWRKDQHAWGQDLGGGKWQTAEFKAASEKPDYSEVASQKVLRSLEMVRRHHTRACMHVCTRMHPAEQSKK